MNLSLDSQLYSCWVGAQLPVFLAYACRKEDVDACVVDYGRGVPFHAVKMMAARKVLPGRRHIKVATAAYIVPGPPGSPRRVCLDLVSRKSINIYTVRANDSRLVRAQLRAHGLRRLFDWLRSCSVRSVFWQAHDHWADLIYDIRNRTLTFSERK